MRKWHIFLFFSLLFIFFVRVFYISDLIVIEKRQEIIGNPQRLHAKNKTECLKCQSATNTTKIGCGHYFCCECISEQGCELCGMLASVEDAEVFVLQIEKEINATKQTMKWEKEFEEHQADGKVCLECGKCISK